MKRAFYLVVALSLMIASSALAQDDKAPGARAAGGFKAMDANSDGKVTKDEFLEHARKLAEKRWDKLDVNKQGYITMTDLQAARQKRHAEGKGHHRGKGADAPAAPAAPATPAAQ